MLKFIYSEKATKYCEISTVDLSYVVPVKSKVEILQNFVAFSEYYMNFNWKIELDFFQNFGFLKICHLVLAKFAAAQSFSRGQSMA